MAELDDAARLQLPRGSGHLPGVVRRPRDRARDRLPDVVHRDGRPLPRRLVRPLPAYGLRHRRVGPRLHDHVAGARLRLPRRDPLPRRRPARHQGRAVHDQERHLPARGGQRRPLEARRPQPRRRGPADAPDGGVVPRDRRELRVPRLLALLPGRQHRVRGARDRADGHHAVRRGRLAATDRHRRRQPDLRAVPPALPGRPARPRRRRRPEHRDGGRLEGAAGVRGQPLRTGRRHRGHAGPLRGGVGPRLQLGDPAVVEGGQPEPHQLGRDQPGVQAGPERVDPADDGARTPRSTSARRSSATRSG